MSNSRAAFRPIVVGVDGSPLSRDALRWAAVEAELRDCPLDVVYGWQVSTQPRPPGVDLGVAPPLEAYQEAATRRIEQVVAKTLPERLRARVRVHAVHKPPGKALIWFAQDADLLVVGSRTHGRLAGWLLGSVSDEAIENAPCAAVIVRADCVPPFE
jgi:nucleotide-binding universal stress UspA family protein